MIIDFHSHILPKVDDGSKSTVMSLEMMAAARENHVDVMIATPHFYPALSVPEHVLQKRNRAYMHLQTADGFLSTPIILLGAEVAFFPGISRSASTLVDLCIQNTNLLLIEMPFDQWTINDINEIAALSDKGFQIVIVHYERFIRFQKNKIPMETLLSLPVLIQINAESFISWSDRRKVLKLFKNYKAHLLGSDCHNTTSRPQNLGIARDMLEKHLGSDYMREFDTFGSQLITPALRNHSI